MERENNIKWGLLIFVAFMVYFLHVMADQQKILNSKEKMLNNMQAKVQEETKINEELKNQKEILETDEFVEKVAREKLGMVKPGERIFIDINWINEAIWKGSFNAKILCFKIMRA